jgi:hypothetical protein
VYKCYADLLKQGCVIQRFDIGLCKRQHISCQRHLFGKIPSHLNDEENTGDGVFCEAIVFFFGRIFATFTIE